MRSNLHSPQPGKEIIIEYVDYPGVVPGNLAEPRAQDFMASNDDRQPDNAAMANIFRSGSFDRHRDQVIPLMDPALPYGEQVIPNYDEEAAGRRDGLVDSELLSEFRQMKFQLRRQQAQLRRQREGLAIVAEHVKQKEKQVASMVMKSQRTLMANKRRKGESSEEFVCLKKSKIFHPRTFNSTNSHHQLASARRTHFKEPTAPTFMPTTATTGRPAFVEKRHRRGNNANRAMPRMNRQFDNDDYGNNNEQPEDWQKDVFKFVAPSFARKEEGNFRTKGRSGFMHDPEEVEENNQNFHLANYDVNPHDPLNTDKEESQRSNNRRAGVFR